MVLPLQKIMMKNILLFLLPFTLMAFTVASLKPVDTDDAVTFTIKNFGLNTNGSFKALKGKINWDAENPAASTFDITVDANTINTGLDARDSHLRKEDYFNVDAYPVIRFSSTAITPSNVTGNLTIKGVTNKISFPFTVKPSAGGYLFQGSFVIGRRDFGVGGGSAVLSDNANVYLKIQANP